MPTLIAADAQGTLSRDGALTNPAFDSAQVGDTAVLTLSVDAGYVRPAYTVPGVAGVSLSLDGSTWGASGADIAVGDVSTGTALHLRLDSASASLVALALPQDGIVALSGDVTVAASPLTAASSIPAVTVDVAGSVSVAASPLVIASTMPAVTVDTVRQASVTASALTSAATMPSHTATGTDTGFVNDFAAGESLNSHLHLFNTDDSLAWVGSNLLNISRGTAGSAGWVCDIPISKTVNTRIKMRYKRVSGSGASSNYPLRLFHDSAMPTVTSEFPSSLNSVLLGYNDSADAGYLRHSNSASNNWAAWDFVNGDWNVPATAAAEELFALAENTIAETWIEMEANGGSPQFRFIQKNASGVTITNGTTNWILFTAISDWASTSESFYVGGHLSGFTAQFAITKLSVERY